MDDEDNPWYFAEVYGFHEEHNKRKMWQLIQDLSEDFGDNLLFFGDFNDITQDYDKNGDNSITTYYMCRTLKK